MREETIKLYKFNELEEEAQEKVLEKFRNINVEYTWWDFLFEDFKNRGMKH